MAWIVGCFLALLFVVGALAFVDISYSQRQQEACMARGGELVELHPGGRACVKVERI